VVSVAEIDQPANERSRRTRRALLGAARVIIEEDGFDAVTMHAVAERAGVSRGGAYLHFDSAGALIAALFDHIVETEDLHGSVAAVWQAPNAASALDAWARHLADYHPRVMPIDLALQRVEQRDPAAAGHRARVCAAQRANCDRLATSLADGGRLADGWSVATASDLLYGLIASEMIDRWLTHCGWSTTELGDRLSLVLRSTLVRPARTSTTEAR
jgi:AcrR family transcriptional regulator